MNESEFLHNVKSEPTASPDDPKNAPTAPEPLGCMTCSASDSSVDCHDSSFTIPLDVFVGETPFSGGEINLASIGSLFIDYVANWQEKLRELMSKAQIDKTLESGVDGISFNYYPHWIASSDNAKG